ncbi:MAG: efflux RND transporter periplasmic adaptor subunit [Muribaculum sp.]|nr:efflux RND transporter periplasmic adaptor subunit [Muribaculaceae bacterium]MCM1080929.1 efflux RND transporter periplasmic adaptor subunit [Muribaculum sp.]
MKRTCLLFAMPSLLAVALTMFCACSGKHKPGQEADDVTQVSVAKPLVKSVMVHKSYPGYTYANATANVVARVNGQLISKSYSGGDFVEKGKVLFNIEPTQYSDAVRQAEAALTTANSQYEYTSREYEAMKRALESDAVSAMDVVQAKSSMQQAQADIKKATAALSDARTNLSYCTVRAPFSGRISGSTLDVGAYVSGAGAPVTLATIYDDSQVVVVFNIEDSQYDHVLETQRTNDSIYNNIPVVLQEQSGKPYMAKLNYTAPSIDKSTGTFTMKAAIDNKNGELRDGMYATVNLPIGVVDNAILVNDASISTDQLGKYLYTLSDSNTVVYTPIKIGELYNDSLRIVTDGITADSRYVTSALLKVREGMKVKPIE